MLMNSPVTTMAFHVVLKIIGYIYWLLLSLSYLYIINIYYIIASAAAAGHIISFRIFSPGHTKNKIVKAGPGPLQSHF